MNILLLTIPITLIIALGFLLAFIWSTRSGQFDDLETPAMRILDEKLNNEEEA